MTERKIGEIVDQLGVSADLDDSDHVLDVVVLARVASTDDGETRFACWWSAGMDFITRRGLIASADDMERATTVAFYVTDDEEGEAA